MRRHKSDVYYQWEKEAAYALRLQGFYPAEYKPTTHVWELVIQCHLGDRRRDIDNTLKSGIDFIASFFGLSDNYLDEITIIRHSDKKHPRWEVKLTVRGA